MIITTWSLLSVCLSSVPCERAPGGAGAVGGVRGPHGVPRRRRELPSAAETTGLLSAAPDTTRQEQGGAARQGKTHTHKH